VSGPDDADRLVSIGEEIRRDVAVFARRLIEHPMLSNRDHRRSAKLQHATSAPSGFRRDPIDVSVLVRLHAALLLRHGRTPDKLNASVAAVLVSGLAHRRHQVRGHDGGVDHADGRSDPEGIAGAARVSEPSQASSRPVAAATNLKGEPYRGISIRPVRPAAGTMAAAALRLRRRAACPVPASRAPRRPSCRRRGSTRS
jgi:hypothetical protein